MNRRDVIKLSSYVVASASASAIAGASAASSAPGRPVPRWDVHELKFTGPSSGNPFLDVSLTATFSRGNRAMTVEGFYDGDGVYRVRFMPDELGEWSWTTSSNAPGLTGKSGGFQCVAPDANNRGPVSVRDGFHFAYADGTAFVECGTTCYAWAFQPKRRSARPSSRSTASPFNKLRMCLFPKWYQHNRKEPPLYPVPAQR